MKIQTNTTERKALVKAIAAELHTEARYLRTPTYAYQIGDFTVDRDGNIIGEDFAPLHSFLLANGYITEEPETATEVEVSDAPVENNEAEPAEDANEDANVPDAVTEAEPAEDAVEDTEADALVEVTQTEPIEDTAEDADADVPDEVAEAKPTEDAVEDAEADALVEVTEMEPIEDAEADVLVEDTEVEPTEDDTEDSEEDVPVEATETEPTEDAAEDEPVEDTEAEFTEDIDAEPTEATAEDASADVEVPVETADEEPTDAIAEDDAADLEAPVEASDEEPADEADAKATTEDDTEDAFTDVEGPVEVADVEPTETSAEDDTEDAIADLEAPVEAADAEPVEATTKDDIEDATEDATADLEAPVETSTEEPADDSDPDTQTITIPALGITAAQLRNLTFILYSRQYLLGLMTGGDTIRIPVETVQSLQRAMPDTPEDFSLFLKIHRMSGLKGFDFKDGQFSMTFPICENEPARWTTFAGLQGRILQAAMTAKRVAPDLIQPEEEAEKYTAHIWLQRLGYKGLEMKEQRNILLHHLHGYCAFSNGEKMQRHKDKYSTIRKRRQGAERTTAQIDVEASAPATITSETTAPQTIAPETIAPETTTTEAMPIEAEAPVVDFDKDVAADE